MCCQWLLLCVWQHLLQLVPAPRVPRARAALQREGNAAAEIGVCCWPMMASSHCRCARLSPVHSSSTHTTSSAQPPPPPNPASSLNPNPPIAHQPTLVARQVAADQDGRSHVQGPAAHQAARVLCGACAQCHQPAPPLPALLVCNGRQLLATSTHSTVSHRTLNTPAMQGGAPGAEALCAAVLPAKPRRQCLLRHGRLRRRRGGVPKGWCAGRGLGGGGVRGV